MRKELQKELQKEEQIEEEEGEQIKEIRNSNSDHKAQHNKKDTLWGHELPLKHREICD